MWAAAGGNLEALATTFVLEEGARTKAAAVFATLPEAARAQYGTPEKLIAALFIAKDLPLSVKLGGVVAGPESTKLLLQVQTAGGGSQQTNILLRAEPDGWRVIVAEDTVGKYAAMLAGAAKADGGK